jgi:ribosomal protein S12 methylthiotransferase accessory factor
LGANGKGVSKEYCLASAYAEFFERYENDLLGNAPAIPDHSNLDFFVTADEQLLSTKELLEQQSSFFDSYFSARNMSSSSLEEKISSFEAVHLDNAAHDGKHVSIPFWSNKYRSIVYLPKQTYTIEYGSNGMSAGNTIEEAIVQGFSEIIERYVQSLMFSERIVPPDIPDEYVKQYPLLYEMLSAVRNNPNYYAMLKDCSLGGKYPVAAFVVIEKNTGRYGIKLGCHPSYPIAIERTFTEATQGQDIFEYTNRSTLDFSNHSVNDQMNVFNSFKVGYGQYPFELFGTRPSYDFSWPQDITSLSNKDLAKMMCGEFLEKGYDVLIRDVSYFGFPAVHIIIPGFSELYYVSDSWFRVFNTRDYAAQALMHPDAIDYNSAKYISGVLDRLAPSFLENSINTYYMWACPKDVPFWGAAVFGSYFMSALARTIMQDYEGASARMKAALAAYSNPAVLNRAMTGEAFLPEKKFIEAAYQFLSGMSKLNDKSEVMKYLDKFFTPEVIAWIDRVFVRSHNCIGALYPEYSNDGKNTEALRAYAHLTAKHREYQLKHPIDQNSLSRLLS